MEQQTPGTTPTGDPEQNLARLIGLVQHYADSDPIHGSWAAELAWSNITSFIERLDDHEDARRTGKES